MAKNNSDSESGELEVLSVDLIPSEEELEMDADTYSLNDNVPADSNAESAPCESTMVVMQECCGSGGRRTRVMIPGTISEKCRDTKVEMRDDLPTPDCPTNALVWASSNDVS